MHPLANSADIKNVRFAQLLRSVGVHLSNSIIQSNVVSFGTETHDIFGEWGTNFDTLHVLLLTLWFV